jgi:hypothetical protein
MALSPSIANVKTAGISAWAIKDATRPDVGYSTIPYLRNGKVGIKPLEVKDTRVRLYQYAYEVTASAEFLASRTTADFIKLLASLGNNVIDHRITMINGQIFSSAPANSTPSPTGFGTEWELISDKDFDDVMFVRITATRKITIAEYTQIITSANVDATAANASDTFLLVASLARTDLVPAGITQFECGTSVSYGDVVSNLRNGKFNAKSVSVKESHGMPIVHAIDITFELEGLETSETELKVWDNICTRDNYVKLTFAGGATIALALNTGVTMGYTSDKDMDDIARVDVKGQGRIIPSSWAALWSA